MEMSTPHLCPIIVFEEHAICIAFPGSQLEGICLESQMKFQVETFGTTGMVLCHDLYGQTCFFEWEWLWIRNKHRNKYTQTSKEKEGLDGGSPDPKLFPVYSFIGQKREDGEMEFRAICFQMLIN